VKNIQKRGRDYEQTMPLEYLSNLNERYDDFIYHKYKGKVLVVDVDNIDFEHKPQEFASIIDKIDAHLFGLFPD
jgi:deoxyadenosine/deoxycytidine kinase